MGDSGDKAAWHEGNHQPKPTNKEPKDRQTRPDREKPQVGSNRKVQPRA